MVRGTRLRAKKGIKASRPSKKNASVETKKSKRGDLSGMLFQRMTGPSLGNAAVYRAWPLFLGLDRDFKLGVHRKRGFVGDT